VGNRSIRLFFFFSVASRAVTGELPAVQLALVFNGKFILPVATALRSSVETSKPARRGGPAPGPLIRLRHSVPPTQLSTRHPIVQRAVQSDCAPDQLCRRQSLLSAFIKKVFPNAQVRPSQGARGQWGAGQRCEDGGPGAYKPLQHVKINRLGGTVTR
jgi:hypothetical protein